MFLVSMKHKSLECTASFGKRTISLLFCLLVSFSPVHSYRDGVLKSLFTGQTTTTTNSAEDWMRIGVPEQDAHHYQSELDAGRSMVLIKAVPNPEQALSILRQSGAYDIAFRFRTTPPTMLAGANNPNAQLEANNPNAQPGPYNPNTQLGPYDATQPQPRQPISRDERKI